MKNEPDEKQNVLNDEIRFLNELLKPAPPEKIAYAIIKGFCYVRYEPSPELRDRFHAWLITGDAEAKNKALEICFNEAVEETVPEESSPETRDAEEI